MLCASLRRGSGALKIPAPPTKLKNLYKEDSALVKLWTCKSCLHILLISCLRFSRVWLNKINRRMRGQQWAWRNQAADIDCCFLSSHKVNTLLIFFQLK
jgi:hypothetical protein